MDKYVCIHGHFYQPPRENAWLEEVELQDSAHPFHDWNERITAECYGPNGASRILGDTQTIKKIVNNYAKISFNFGPTLLSWMQVHANEAYQAILEADKESMQYFSGHGSAMAQAYNHIILPLANTRDKETQVIWGIKDFQSRFNRMPEGMWLAETAVDTESLEIMARHGLKFTLLAPRQAGRSRKIGATEWTDLHHGKVDPRRPYLCNLPSGNTIAIFFYDGGIAQDVAFNNLLANGKHFADRLIAGFGDTNGEPQLAHIATDGESYGHHHRHGDMALAYCLDYIVNNGKARITNYGEYLDLFPPTHEVEIIENSSWSCVHGVERWRSNCGCNTGGRPEWNQEWRKPLRDSLDWLRDHAIIHYEEQAAQYLTDPWAARNDFIDVILSRTDETLSNFLQKHAKRELGRKDTINVLRLLEMQRNAMLMFTSCGWFFDEVSGIETTQIMQYAARTIQLAEQTANVELEKEFLERLGEANSNIPEHIDGANIYRKFVIPTRLDLTRVGMHYAIASLFEEYPEKLDIFNYVVESIFFDRVEGGIQRLAIGKAIVKSKTTYSEKEFSFAVLYIGQHNIIGNIAKKMSDSQFIRMHLEITDAFKESRIGDVIGIMQSYFGEDKYTIWHLFKDEKRKVMQQLMKENLEAVETTFRRMVDRDYQLLNAMKNDNIPVPRPYRASMEFILNVDLLKYLNSETMNIRKLQQLVSQFKTWDAHLEDTPKVSHVAGESIHHLMHQIGKDKHNVETVKTLNQLFGLLDSMGIHPELSQSQNLYFSIAAQNGKADPNHLPTNEWQREFSLLGKNVGVKLA